MLSFTPGFGGVPVDDPELDALPGAEVPPEAEPDMPEVEPEVEPEALPLMPPLEAPGAELELELPDAGGVTVTEVLELESRAAPGAVELELELPGDAGDVELLELELLGERGAVLEPVLLDEDEPGWVTSLDFCGDDGRSQPLAASAIATAAATSVRWVSLCMHVSFGWGCNHHA